MHSIRFLSVLILSMILFSCSAKHTESSAGAAARTTDTSSMEADNAHTAADSQSAGVLTKAQGETLQKAKQVENLLQETQEKNIKQVDDAEE